MKHWLIEDVKITTVVSSPYQLHIQNYSNNDNAAIQEFLYLGVNESNPAISCAEIFKKKLSTPSGYYWLRSDNGSAVRVFCDMTLTCKGVGGGWMQVAKLNMTNSSHQCPPGTRLRTYLPERLRVCGRIRNAPGCTSSVFNVHGIRYSHVCGRIIGYQFVSPDAFGAYSPNDRDSSSIDGNYVDGISLTHGRNPREHIWTFAGGLSETGSAPYLNCPCTNSSQAEFATPPPSFVGNDYFCDTGSTNQWESYRFYLDNPLWDGAGCGPDNTCCSLNNPPWFLKQLPSTTTDDIEMRMCFDQEFFDEDVPIEIIELYVQWRL